MSLYLAKRIELGKLNYNVIIGGFPNLQTDIDEIIAADGYVVNEEGTVTKA